MSAENLNYLYMVIGAMGIFAIALAWTEWFSNRR